MILRASYELTMDVSMPLWVHDRLLCLVAYEIPVILGFEGCVDMDWIIVGYWRRYNLFLVISKVQSTFVSMKQQSNKITVEQFATTFTSRRGHPVSPSYIYRLIRQHIKGQRLSVPFRYELEGNKDRIWILP